GRAAFVATCVVGDGFTLLVDFLGLHGQAHHAVLAIHADHTGFDVVTLVQGASGVLDALAGQLGGTQVALDAVAEIDARALAVHFDDLAGHHRALRMLAREQRERILVQLLDAERAALAPGIHGQHHRLDFVALLVITDGFLARQVPGDVGQVNQAVDAAIQADEDAEIGNRLDLAGEAVALLVCRGELFPRVRHALLHAEADAAAFLVDVEHHDFDFVADLHDLARVDVLVGPV